jgi:hypothetical protein
MGLLTLLVLTVKMDEADDEAIAADDSGSTILWCTVYDVISIEPTSFGCRTLDRFVYKDV